MSISVIATYVGDGNGLIVVAAQVLEQVLDQDGALGNLALDAHRLVVGGGEVDDRTGGGISGCGHGCGNVCLVW